MARVTGARNGYEVHTCSGFYNQVYPINNDLVSVVTYARLFIREKVFEIMFWPVHAASSGDLGQKEKYCRIAQRNRDFMELSQVCIEVKFNSDPIVCFMQRLLNLSPLLYDGNGGVGRGQRHVSII
jgi:hypothetical protein